MNDTTMELKVLSETRKTSPANCLFPWEVAHVGHTTERSVKEVYGSEHMSYLLEEKVLHAHRRVLAQEEVVNILIVSRLRQFGLPLPTAAGIVISIREQLMFYPSDIVHVELRRNGRLFAFVTDEAPEAAEAAGAVQLRLTIDLDGYRAAFREALAARQPAAERASA